MCGHPFTTSAAAVSIHMTVYAVSQ